MLHRQLSVQALLMSARLAGIQMISFVPINKHAFSNWWDYVRKYSLTQLVLANWAVNVYFSHSGLKDHL